ncbi:MAG TPA: hypothetical protein VGX23_01145 [Actinocrinis sp.]|nr:hypothetical protein [Actinocrinis sp.]
MTSSSRLPRPRHARRTDRPRHGYGAAAAALGLAFALAGVLGAPALAADGSPPAAAGAHPAGLRPDTLRPATGKGCHTYDWWDGYDICIEVFGSGLNVQQVEGWVDGRNGAADVGHLYTTDGDLNTQEHLNGSGQAWFSWTVGGGIWLTNYQNICFTDETVNQTACLALNVS